MSLIGLLFIILSLPLIYKKIKPNRWYGFRTEKTLSDERIWYEANRIAGYDLLIAGIAIVVGSVLISILSKLFPGLPNETLKVALVIVALGIAVIHSFWELYQIE